MENTITHLYPLQQEKEITYWELLYLYSMRFSRQEEPLEKEPDYSHVQESTKSKSKHEESCPVCGVMPRSLEMLPLRYLSSLGIRQSCSTREDKQKEKGVRK